jgi:feruloyl esterase
VFISISVIAGVLLRPSVANADCTVQSLNGFKVPSVSITSATLVPAAPPKPDYCDVKGSVATDGEGAGPNSAGFEIMLPSNWNGKFIFSGVRGTGGSLEPAANVPDEDQFLVKGYASATTDAGHPRSDTNWYFTSPGVPNVAKLTDYFYRATHQVTVAAKQLVKSYYGSKTIAHSYFDGCSNGGKQGPMAAVRYPDDYDGIIAGCPWLDPVGSELNDLKNAKAFLDPASHIPLAKLPEIQDAVNAQCDALDGVKDGLIQNPAKCSFDPQILVPRVLTKAQADALDLYFTGVRDEKGNLISPGSSVSNLQAQFAGVNRNPDGTFVPGVELDTPAPYPTAAQPWGKSRPPHLWNSAGGVILTLGHNDPSFDMNNNVFQKNGVVKSEELDFLYGRLGANIVDDPSRLQPFLKKGGKLLMYHGLNDVPISGYTTTLFYEDLAEQNGGYDKIQNQVRLFMVPGMQHCNDGPAPVYFDTLSALEQWVEKGVGPDGIIASYTENWGKDVVRTMPLCKFPEQAHYNGSGEVTDAKNWSCPSSDRSMLEVGRNGIQAGLNDRKRHGDRVKGTPVATMKP